MTPGRRRVPYTLPNRVGALRQPTSTRGGGMLASNDALEARLRHVETKPVLDLDAVDVAIERIRRPEVVRDRIGDALLYAQRVEAEVGGLSIETLLPHSTNDYVGRFLEVW